MFINEKAILHLLLVLDSLFATNHFYNLDLVVTGDYSSTCHFSRDESLLSILLKVSFVLHP